MVSWGGDVNILFLMCDSMDGRVLDPTSDVSTRMRTPAFTKLAADGVNFINTYAASPQCVPSRTTMLAGRRSDQTKTWSNGKGFGTGPDGQLDSNCVKAYDQQTCSEWGEEQNLTSTFFHSLRAANMDVQIFGKVDIGGGIIDNFGPNVTLKATGFHGGPTLSILTRSADIRKPTKPDPMKITNDNDNHVHSEDWTMISNCINWLKEKGQSRSSKRWFLYCSLNIPHPPFDSNNTWLDFVNDSAVNIPVWPPHEVAEPHPYDSYMSVSKNVQGNFSADEILRVRKTYYAMVSETDYMLGLVIKACKNAGLYDNTVVIFLSDHGEMNMEHRQVWKNAMYEGSSRVPLIVSAGETAGKKLKLKRGVVVKNFVSLLDIYPTLMSIAGSRDPKVDLSGYTLAPMISSDATLVNDHPDYVVSQYFSNMANTGCFMIRRGAYKYIAFGQALSTFQEGYVAQLFNVDNDPQELRNIAANNEAIVVEMDTLLRKELASGSNVISASGDYFEIDRYVKKQQQDLYKRYFLNQTNAEKQYQRLIRCFDNPPSSYEDSEREAPCLLADVNDYLSSEHDMVHSQPRLRKMFEAAYKGFNDSDWIKVNEWISEIP